MAIITTLLSWIGLGLAVISAIGLAITFASTMVVLYLVVTHLRLRRRGLAAERANLTRSLPLDRDLPDVVVQIPTFNEGAMVARALDAALALDWPRDKLHIQLLDDSTDHSRFIAQHEVETRRMRGHDVVLIHRTDREEFKAGALANAMRMTPHDYFVIFDVDYIPAPSFLRQTMACLLADPKIAFAQARFDYLNAETNDLTRAQSLLLDAHLAIEQATRDWAGHPLPFNGTCGVWRRAAIEAAGGWHGGTLAEDLDLSYRAWRKGWRGRFLLTVSVPGELPETRDAWITQQRRWTKGFGEVSIRMLAPVLADRDLSIRDRFKALLHLGVWWSGPFWGLALPVGIVAMVCRPSLLGSLGLLLIGQFIVGYVTLFFFLRSGNRTLRPTMPLRVFLKRFFKTSKYLFSVGAALGPAQREVIFRKSTAFERTPKSAVPKLAPVSKNLPPPAEPAPLDNEPSLGEAMPAPISSR